MLVIVNADDLGTSEVVNNKIFELMEKGLVTSASIISNAPAFEHAVQNIHRFPDCSFGVHLNLTVFKPLIRSKYLQRILDDDGCFSEKLNQLAFSGELTKALQLELSAQVQKAIDSGINVSHFDSHQHVHTIPQLFLILKFLQRQYAIRRVRNTINLYPPGQHPSALKIIKKRAFSCALRNFWSTKSPDGFCSLTTYYKIIGKGSLPHLNSLELMVHPGTTYAPYKEEIELLESSVWQSLLPKHAILGSYFSL